MAKVLVLESNLSDDYSVAQYATNTFLKEYKKNNPNDDIQILDLNNENKLQTILNKNNYLSFWNEESDRYINLFQSADKLIISTAMINFTISQILKNFFDNILQAGKTFKYKYDGKGISEGLIGGNKKVLLFMAQGSYKDWYKFSAFDDYLVHVLKFMGLKNIDLVLFDGTKTKNQRDLSIEERYKMKEEEVLKLIKTF